MAFVHEFHIIIASKTTHINMIDLINWGPFEIPNAHQKKNQYTQINHWNNRISQNPFGWPIHQA